MLLAAAIRAGATAVDLGVGRDDPAALAAFITRGLEADVLVLSGGVSAGVLDLAPKTLASLGVREVFHKVSLKPGKPLWFGILPAGAGGKAASGGQAVDKLVFGLPGNPVSSLVCFELFVRPALDVLSGRPAQPRAARLARLALPFEHRGNRPTYHPACWATADGELEVRTLRWQGSGDLRTLAAANCLACFAPGDRSYQVGDAVAILELSEGN
jgi:molybdopterin molybdotransferase